MRTCRLGRKGRQFYETRLHGMVYTHRMKTCPVIKYHCMTRRAS